MVRLPQDEHAHFKSGGYIQIDVPKVTVDYRDIEVADRFKPSWDHFQNVGPIQRW